MAGIDQHAVQAVFGDGAFQFFVERRAAAGQRAGEDDNAVFIFLLNLGAVFVPAAQEGERLVGAFVFQIMDRVADDAALDAGLFMGFEQVFNGQRRRAAPTPFFGQLGRIDMGMPVDNHVRSFSFTLTSLVLTSDSIALVKPRRNTVDGFL